MNATQKKAGKKIDQLYILFVPEENEHILLVGQPHTKSPIYSHEHKEKLLFHARVTYKDKSYTIQPVKKDSRQLKLVPSPNEGLSTHHLLRDKNGLIFLVKDLLN